MSSPGVWNPDQEQDNEDNDMWFDASDTEELNEDEFLDSREQWMA